MTTAAEVECAVAAAHRAEWATVLAATVRTCRDLDLAEESVQEAYAAALVSWTRDGVPRRPAAWLTTVAKRRSLDAVRRESKLRPRLPLLVDTDDATAPHDGGAARDGCDELDDDRLRLIFMCCHPALAHESQLALTLRLVCGMSTSDIAKTFLVSEATMHARLTRAKKKIQIARIPVRVPAATELPERVDAILAVIYLLSTIGHTAPTGTSLQRTDAADEALRLARLVRELLPAERESGGLLALLLVNNARRVSRAGADGAAVPLSDQDRSTWDHDAIEEARPLIVEGLRGGVPGRYTLQAAIASLHAEAPSFDQVDWPQIVVLYDALLVVWPSPVVRLNRAVALSKTDGALAALAEVEALEQDGRLGRYHYLPAIKAYLLQQLGRTGEAEVANQLALDLATNDVERGFLAAHGG